MSSGHALHGGKRSRRKGVYGCVTFGTDPPRVVALGGSDIGQPQDSISVNKGREQMCKAILGQGLVIGTKRLKKQQNKKRHVTFERRVKYDERGYDGDGRRRHMQDGRGRDSVRPPCSCTRTYLSAFLSAYEGYSVI